MIIFASLPLHLLHLQLTFDDMQHSDLKNRVYFTEESRLHDKTVSETLFKAHATGRLRQM